MLGGDAMRARLGAIGRTEGGAVGVVRVATIVDTVQKSPIQRHFILSDGHLRPFRYRDSSHDSKSSILGN